MEENVCCCEGNMWRKSFVFNRQWSICAIQTHTNLDPQSAPDNAKDTNTCRWFTKKPWPNFVALTQSDFQTRNTRFKVHVPSKPNTKNTKMWYNRYIRVYTNTPFGRASYPDNIAINLCQVTTRRRIHHPSHTHRTRPKNHILWTKPSLIEKHALSVILYSPNIPINNMAFTKTVTFYTIWVAFKCKFPRNI